MTRRRLPTTRRSVTHKVEITDPGSGSYSLYMVLGFYENGKPGELFLKMGKVGSTVNGLLDVVGVLASLLLQHGADPAHVCQKLSNTAFGPAGMTTNPEIPVCTSLADYVFRWLESQAGKAKARKRRKRA